MPENQIHLLSINQLVTSLRPARPVAVASSLVDGEARFLLTGITYDANNRVNTYRCEQIIFDPNIVVALVIDERWEPGVRDPNVVLTDERWESLGLGEPDLLFIDERWDPNLSDPTSTVINELWEA